MEKQNKRQKTKLKIEYANTMKIINTRNRNNTLWCAPILECSKETEKLITKLHDELYGDDWYVVDSLSHKQVLCIMFDDLPFSWLIKKLFVKTETEIVE